MNNKRIITYLTTIWFSLQGMFEIYCPLHVYCKAGHTFYEMLVTGSILLLASLLIVVKNRIIRNIAYFLLWVYSISLAFVVALLIQVASPTPMLALVLTFIMIVNIVLLFLEWYHS